MIYLESSTGENDIYMEKTCERIDLVNFFGIYIYIYCNIIENYKIVTLPQRQSTKYPPTHMCALIIRTKQSTSQTRIQLQPCLLP